VCVCVCVYVWTNVWFLYRLFLQQKTMLLSWYWTLLHLEGRFRVGWENSLFLKHVSIFYSCTVHIPSWVIESAPESESCLVGMSLKRWNQRLNVAFSDSLSIFEKLLLSQRSVQRLIFCTPFRTGILSHIKDRYFDLEPLHLIISVGQFSLFQWEPFKGFSLVLRMRTRGFHINW